MLPSYYEALRPLPDDMRLQMYDAVFDYAFLGKDPEGLPTILSGYFLLLRPNLDSSIKHYSASVENGKKGGRPPKKPSENPTGAKTKPNRNREKEKEKEKEKETEMEKEKEKSAPPTAASPSADKPSRKKYGQYGWVLLTEEAYTRLSADLGQAELDRCIAYVDEAAQSNGNKNRWRDWNLVIRRCHRDGWGLGKGAAKNDTRDTIKTAADYKEGWDTL